MAAAGVVAAGVAALIALPAATASADPSPSDWSRLRTCESGNDYSINTGNDHYGAYQFDLPTWRSVGGSGFPNTASAAEQDARALILYRERGWQPWQCAGILGLREDSDAGSGRIGDIKIPGTGSSGGTNSGSPSSIPAFPGPRWFQFGDNNPTIKQFQDQMHARGFFPVGTGEYGPNTLAMVKRLQSLNGLQPNGFIGPNTWRMAWTGKYSTATVSKPPVVNKPVVNKPVVNKPVVNKPAVNKPAVNKPVVNKPVVNKPVVNVPSTPGAVHGPTVGLATTGGDLARWSALGSSLLALGLGLVFAGRRRRRPETV